MIVDGQAVVKLTQWFSQPSVRLIDQAEMKAASSFWLLATRQKPGARSSKLRAAASPSSNARFEVNRGLQT
jgi:hypothetical protein